jgi:hypothetical protein
MSMANLSIDLSERFWILISLRFLVPLGTHRLRLKPAGFVSCRSGSTGEVAATSRFASIRLRIAV